MGILSWFSARRSADKQVRLLRRATPADDSPEIADIKRAAAAEVAAMEKDDKYFGAQDPEDDL